MRIIFKYNGSNFKLDVYSFFTKLILLNSLVSLTARIYPSWLPLGKVIGGLTILVLIGIYCRELRYIDGCFLSALVLFSILPIIKSTNMGETIEHVLDFFIAMLILWKAASSKFRGKLLHSMNKSKSSILFNINLSIIILFISFFISSNYVIINNEKVFLGFSISNHILCGTVFLYMILLLVYLNDKEFKLKYLTYCGVYIYAILMSGARTYLISVVCFLIALYILKLRKYSLRYLIIPSGIISFFYAFFNSSAYLRFMQTKQNQYISSNKLEAITSGRLIWWKIDIKQYMDFSFIERLFGAGHSIVYDINEMYYSMRIWAHNDFIQLLLAIGIIGLLFYLFVLIRFLWNVQRSGTIGKVKFSILVVISSFIVNAIFNGYYGNLRMIMATIWLTLLLFKTEKNNILELEE